MEICKHVFFFHYSYRHIVRYSLFMSSDQKKRKAISQVTLLKISTK